MKLYARRTSSNCQKVLWFLAELGLEYEFVATGGDAGVTALLGGVLALFGAFLVGRG